MTENLWPDFDLAAKPRTVRRILIEAGAGLEEKTHGSIRFEVETAPRGNGGFVHNCYLVAPGLGYRYPLMRVENGLDQYPAMIHSDRFKLGTPATDEKSLEGALRQVFQDESTKKVVVQLLDVISDDSSSSPGGEGSGGIMNIEFKLPELGENVHSGDVVSVLVHEGDRIAANDGVIELETDKAVVEIPCPHAGRVAKLHVAKGQTIQVGQTILTVESAEAAPAATTEPPLAASQAEPKTATAKPQAAIESVPAGPATRRLARELGVDLARVSPSGSRGRITPEDVQAAAGGAAVKPPAEAAKPPAGEPGQDAWGKVRREGISRIRRTIAEQMVRSAGIIPHVTNFDDADVTDLEGIRRGVPAGHLGPAVKLSLLPFAMKAVAACLRLHPVLNASFDTEHDQVVYKEYVNLGVAVDTPRGLVVPSVRNADRMSVIELARAVADLSRRAREGRFGVEDLRGGTFTLSNMGAVGGTYSTPIINHPEVAILLLGRARWLPVVRGECHHRVEPRLMMPLSLSYDHRLVDGAAAARFLNDVIRMLESPGLLVLGS